MGRVILKNESHKSCPFTIMPLTGAWFCCLGHANSLDSRLWPMGKERGPRSLLFASTREGAAKVEFALVVLLYVGPSAS